MFCYTFISQHKETLLLNYWRLTQKANKGPSFVKKIFEKRDRSDIVFDHQVYAPVCKAVESLYLRTKVTGALK